VRRPFWRLPVLIQVDQIRRLIELEDSEKLDNGVDAVMDVIRQGGLLEQLITKKLIDLPECKGDDGQKQRDAYVQLLLQMLDLSGLVVVIHVPPNSPEPMHTTEGTLMGVLDAFIRRELLAKQTRMLLISDVMYELPVADATFAISARGMYLKGVLLPDDKAYVNLIRDAVKSKRVTSLHLSHVQLGEHGARAVRDVLKSRGCQLESLDLSVTGMEASMWGLVAAGFEANASLTYLDMREPTLGTDAPLQQVYRLMGVALHRNKEARLRYLRCNAFDVLPGATNLVLDEIKLSCGAVCLLASLLRRNATLTELSLCACAISDEGGQLLASAFPQNTTLTLLKLEHNNELDELATTNLVDAAGATAMDATRASTLVVHL